MRSLSNIVGSLQKILIEPPSHIQDVETRHKSRLLNIFLLPIILVFVGVDITYLATIPGYRPPWYGYVFLLGSYLLNHSRLYHIAAFLTLAMFPVVIFINTVSGASADPVITLYYLVPGLILAGILLLSVKATAFFALIEILVILFIYFVEPYQFPGVNSIVGPLSTMVISTILVLASMWFRDQLEKDRQHVISKAEEKYRNIVENAIDGIFQSTPDGRFISVNSAMARMHGYKSPQEMIRLVTHIPSQMYVDPEVRKTLSTRLANGEKVMGFESQNYRSDKSTLWVSANVQAIHDEDGNILYYEGIAEDITHNKKVEAERRQAEQTLRQFRKLMDESNDAVFVIDLESGRYIDFNRSAFEDLGYTREELGQLTVMNVAQHIPSMQVWRQRVELIREKSGLIFETVYKRKDGITFPVEVSARMQDNEGQTVMVAIVRNITERKYAETALRESEERFRKIFHSSPIAICITTIDDGRLLDANNAYWEITGHDPETSIGRNAKQLKMWDDLQARTEFTRELKEKYSISKPNDHVFDADGNLKPVIAFYEFILIGDEECILSMFYDMSIQKQLEVERENLIRQLETQNAESETLRESLASILSTFEFTEIIQHILDQIRRVVPYDSASVWRLEGNRQRFIGGRDLPDMFSNSDVEFLVDEANSAGPILTGKVPYILNNNVQEELADFNILPHTYVHSWLAIPLKTRGKIIGLVALDGKMKGMFNEHHAELAVTFANQVAMALENSRLFKELQTELSVREKLIRELESKNAELERFTYTVSHDLKSPLVTINGFLGYLEQDAQTGNSQRLREDMQRIQDAVNKMHRLLSELLELSRVGRLMNKPEKILFEDLVRDVLELTHGRLESRRVTVQTQPGLPAVYGDRQRLTEFLQNLVDNSAKFMGDQTNPRIEIGVHDGESGEPVFFVKDNGMGISPQYHGKIFGLFDKLDAKTEGTGIGLALVKRIIELHGGHIWVESQEGEGCTFYFTLPGREALSSQERL